MATSPMDAATVKEAADMLAKRIVVLRLQKQAGGLSDYVEPVVNKATELVDKAAPHVQKFYQNNTMPIHAGLAGAGIGAAMGGLSGLTSPDPDRRNPGRSALMGGLAGGALGGGIGMLAQHGPELQKLLGMSGDFNKEQNRIDTSNGWLRSLLGGKRTWGDIARDPVGGGAVASAAGLGSWGQNVAAYGAPIALGNEARLFNNARNPLSASNIQAGAGEYLKNEKLQQGLADSFNMKAPGYTAPTSPVTAPPGAAQWHGPGDIKTQLNSAMSNLQTAEPGMFQPMKTLAKTELGQLHATQAPTLGMKDMMRQIGETGRQVRFGSPTGLGRAGLRFGGRAGLYALLPLLASRWQPDTAPAIPTSFSQVFGK